LWSFTLFLYFKYFRMVNIKFKFSCTCLVMEIKNAMNKIGDFSYTVQPVWYRTCIKGKPVFVRKFLWSPEFGMKTEVQPPTVHMQFKFSWWCLWRLLSFWKHCQPVRYKILEGSNLHLRKTFNCSLWKQMGRIKLYWMLTEFFPTLNMSDKENCG
jgi:hypothetical protein